MTDQPSWKYGVCTWIFGDTPLSETAALLSGIGYDGIELMGDLARYPAADVARIAGGEGLAVFSLTPENVDLAHPAETVRAEAVDYYRKLIDFAAQVGAPMVSCHGAVGRIRALSSQEEEEAFLLEGVRAVARHAAQHGVRLCVEVLNRYESHLLNTATQAVDFVDRLDAPDVGILLDAYHMNIEEADPAAALHTAGSRLFCFHAADSNRRGAGRGHTDFAALACALAQMCYTGPVVVECTAPGPDPFTPAKGPDFVTRVADEVAHSLTWLKLLEDRARQEFPTTGNR